MTSQPRSAKSDGGLPTSSLIEIVTDAVAMADINLNLSLSSRSTCTDTDEHDDHEEEEDLQFPDLPLRRAGTFPVATTPTSATSPAAPPRRPSRTASFERATASVAQEISRSLQHDLDSEEDEEIDHQKFRQLLLGKQVGETDGDHVEVNANANSFSFEEQTTTNDGLESSTGTGPGMFKLRARKSSSSAPPKIPNRVGSDHSEKRAAVTPTATSSARQASASTSTPPLGRLLFNRERRRHQHRQSLPSTVFRPLRPARRRRQRSFLQEMLTPDSEGSSKSLRMQMPPKLPSRSESEKSMDANKNSLAIHVPASVFCSASTASSSQKSNATASTDAPKRPRRSLSPIYGDSLRSIFDAEANANLNNNSNHTNEPPASTTCAGGELSQKIQASPLVRRKRKVPTRAKTFSFEYAEQSEDSTSPKSKATTLSNNSCIAMLSKNWDMGRDLSGSPLEVEVMNKTSDSDESGLWTATTWPKPRRTKVPPGRSRTFSFFVKPHSGFALDAACDASSVASPCA